MSRQWGLRAGGGPGWQQQQQQQQQQHNPVNDNSNWAQDEEPLRWQLPKARDMHSFHWWQALSGFAMFE